MRIKNVMCSRGMIVILLRKSVKPIFEMSTPSMTIFPSVASTNRKNESASVLFPEPVLPSIPTYIPRNQQEVRWLLSITLFIPFHQGVPQSSDDVVRWGVQA